MVMVEVLFLFCLNKSFKFTILCHYKAIIKLSNCSLLILFTMGLHKAQNLKFSHSRAQHITRRWGT